MPATIEYDEYLQIWTFSASNALDLFGLNPNHYSVTVLKDKPTTEREIERYKPECKLFGIKAIKVVDYYTIEIPYVVPGFRTQWHPTVSEGAFSTLTRGAYKTQAEAIMWARGNLDGMPYTVKPIMRLATDKPTLTLTTNDIIGPDDTGRFAVDDVIELTSDCELGHTGERFVVEDVDGIYMTVHDESNPARQIRTGRDYKHFNLAGGDITPYQRSLSGRDGY